MKWVVFGIGMAFFAFAVGWMVFDSWVDEKRARKLYGK